MLTWYHFLIVALPVLGILWLAFYSRRYSRGVADFLSAGRVAGRYVISVSDMIDTLSVITLVAMCEANYQTGFAMSYWNNVLLPLSVFLSLCGWVNVRFRECRVLSGGQFLEMRYSRSLRVFATVIRVSAEMLANCIGPAVAARFFIYLLGLPHRVDIAGHEVSSFSLLLFVCIGMALAIILAGGRISLIVTDCVQGLISYPIFVIFAVFVFSEFSWAREVAPVMADRVAGESFLNPYDIQNLRDFNMFALALHVVKRVFGNVWLGNDMTTVGRTPHEQKMAGIIATWRGGFSHVTCMMLVIVVMVVMHHSKYAERARGIRVELCERVADEIVADGATRADVSAAVRDIPAAAHAIGVDAPMSRKRNLDTPYMDAVHEALLANAPGKTANKMFQNFRSLYNQMMLPVLLRDVFPPVLLALFLLLCVALLISTDDSRIFNSSSTIVQDLVIPFCKTPPSPELHVKWIKLATVGVCVVFFVGSTMLSQLDFINLFLTIASSIWVTGAASVVTFGLYSRRGTTAGAYAALIGAGGFSALGMVVQRNWAEIVYPFLDAHGWVPACTAFFAKASAPFHPWIVWEMNPVKFPVNSVEITFSSYMLSIALYWIVSLATCRKPFNLDRMLHRGIYRPADEPPPSPRETFTWRRLLRHFVNITPDYTRGDRITAWGIFAYSIVYKFGIAFLAVVLWNAVSPWGREGWSTYFLWTSLIIPGLAACFTTVWFFWGGLRDLLRLFRDLDARKRDSLDNGMVSGAVSLADKEEFARRERDSPRRR